MKNRARSINHNIFFTSQKYSFLPAVLTGILLVLIHSPVSLFPLAFISLVPLFVSFKDKNPSYNFKSGLISGITAYLGLIYWVTVAMNRYGGLDIFTSVLIMLLLVLYNAAYIGVFAYVVTFLELRFSLSILLSAPLVWVILEYIRGFFLSGFPWALLAYSQHNFLTLIQVTSITGVYFISFLIVATNCIFYHIWTKKRVPFLYSSVVVLLITASIFYGFMRLNTDAAGEKRKVTIIQGNIGQDVKWDEKFKAKTVEKYINMTTDYGKGADLIIWPETAMPFAINTAKNMQMVLKSLAISMNSHLLFGTVHVEDGDKFYNSAYLIDKDARVAGIYNKVHLVPFGEYTPLKEYIPFLEKITATGGNFTPGKSHQPIKSSIGNIGVLICYEGIFPHISIDTVRNGAEVLVNLTNDAWYDRTSAPFQHLTFYIFRAIETERYILRAANTGISAVIDTRGRIKSKTDIFTDAALNDDFILSNSKTFYVRFGDFFVYVVMSVFTLLVVVHRKNKRI